ncbi:MAG TPA: hypothetical protein VGK67_00850 [Myxococcales bacterium]
MSCACSGTPASPDAGGAPSALDAAGLGDGGGALDSGVAGPCTASTACPAATPVCDLASGECGRCTPASDACPAGQFCSAPTLTCEPGCKADSDCPDPTAGPALTCDLTAHTCVGCKQDDALCPPGLVCRGELCAPGCTAAHGCADAKVCCSGACLDTQADPDHCGTCAPCPATPHGSVRCQQGVCELASCDPGFDDCNGVLQDGCEEDLRSTAEHCGTCETSCSAAQGAARCLDSACAVASCDTGWGDCDHLPGNGCEADLSIDALNCSACGKACEALPHAETACKLGGCTFGGCLAGYSDCNHDLTDGCEISHLSDPDNCGSCGVICPDVAHGARACVGGVCAIGPCDLGHADCDQDLWNGCEVDTDTDVDHCGGCNQPCTPGVGDIASCGGGVCGLGGCRPGFADCDADPSNGCEVNLASDVFNCAVCGNACPALANATTACRSFVCGIDTCAPDFADCSAGAANGCETSLATDTDHCGDCSTICPAVAHGSRACTAKVCGIGSCATGFDDCDHDPSNGCEVDLLTDAQNCNACGAPCPAPSNALPACVGGVCGQGACLAGFADCSGPLDGCEVATTNDPNNCGGCGIVCGSGSCTAGKCDCSRKVLILKDDSDTGTAVLAAALTAAGFTVTTSAVPAYQYNGTNPALATFGAVIVLAGGPSGQPSVTTDMPAAGQTALVNFFNAGNGLVFTEWAAFHVASGRWQTLKPLVLLSRTVAYSGQVTYSVDPAFAAHPVWQGLPASFTFASTSNAGLTQIAPGTTRVAGSPQAIDAVAIRDLPRGRIVHVAHAGNYASNGWTNPNVQRLLANAAGWVARCQ